MNRSIECIYFLNQLLILLTLIPFHIEGLSVCRHLFLLSKPPRKLSLQNVWLPNMCSVIAECPFLIPSSELWFWSIMYENFFRIESTIVCVDSVLFGFFYNLLLTIKIWFLSLVFSISKCGIWFFSEPWWSHRLQQFPTHLFSSPQPNPSPFKLPHPLP